MDLYQILEKVSVINRDNGSRFTRTDRLDAITSLLWDSRYRRINHDGLFQLYSKKPLAELSSPLVVVSSHVDVERNITNCFTRREGDFLRGTYDNAITNAAILSAMLSDNLPENVLVSFTGDEERESSGAVDLVRFLRQNEIEPQVIVVLDVTDMGWSKGADFTVENNFWDDALGRSVISVANQAEGQWMFVPSDPRCIPAYIEQEHVIMCEAEADESWDYDENHIPCFSFCVPIQGEMHSNAGVIARESSFHKYASMLVRLCRMLSQA